MLNKKMSPLDGLFDRGPTTPKEDLPIGRELRDEQQPPEDMQSILKNLQQEPDPFADPQQQAAANPYGQPEGAMDSPEGDMMQQFMEDQRQKKAKDTYLFR